MMWYGGGGIVGGGNVVHRNEGKDDIWIQPGGR